jgi:hypothetical protein
VQTSLTLREVRSQVGVYYVGTLPRMFHLPTFLVPRPMPQATKITAENSVLSEVLVPDPPESDE